MPYQNKNFINYNPLRDKIVLAVLISVLCISLFIIAFIFFYVFIFEDRAQDKCTDINIDNSTINSGLVLYFHFNNQQAYGENSTFVYDFSGNGNNGKIYGAIWNSKGGKLGDGAFEFSDLKDNIKINDFDSLSPSTFGQHFTVSFWAKFDETTFIGEGSQKNYINFLGKGNSVDGQEFVFRQYNSSNSEGRNNRISFYAFNQEGGLGAGSYFQENIREGEWIYITGVISGTPIKIYKNGVLRNSNLLSEYSIQMKNTEADLYIGKQEGDYYFNGSIDELRVYNKSLNDCQVRELYDLSNRRQG